MRKMLFFACLLLGLSACEKDPDMNQLDADLVVYTDYYKDADFGGYKTYFLPESILEAGGHRAYIEEASMQNLPLEECLINHLGKEQGHFVYKEYVS